MAFPTVARFIRVPLGKKYRMKFLASWLTLPSHVGT
jgi:hypothetical protein